ncbi:MAG: hypothetical protein HQK87_03310 [Nitrospinae bacterium]|nr:hypothetical protein [Nitrospinota bacterium]
MSSKKILLMAVGWLLLALPILSKALSFSVMGLGKETLFALCWLVGAPILVYAKIKMR